MRNMHQAGGCRAIFVAPRPGPSPCGRGEKKDSSVKMKLRGCPHTGVDSCNRIAKGCTLEGVPEDAGGGRRQGETSPTKLN
jgi:hypothetical protein